jgi:hypothetical protein
MKVHENDVDEAQGAIIAPGYGCVVRLQRSRSRLES